ncbi:Fc.00g112690.m01.CDS01 [Cosmosporella sp. VM-42]
MAPNGPSLSHILDPPRPPSDPALLVPHTYTHSPHNPMPGAGAGASSTSPQLFHSTPGAAISHPSVTQPHPAPTSNPATPSIRGHTGTSLYACGDCGRRYSRPEHLQRHVQTHTLGRRFSCSVCGKSFARADLKKRHESNHDNDSKKRRRTATSPAAGRVAHACKACAAARVKCQEDKPCQRCVRRGLTCMSSEAGSAAAMHLMHLSANAHSSNSSPEGPEDSSSPAQYGQPGVASAASLSGQQEIDQGSPMSRTTPVKPEGDQLPTPDTVMEQAPSINVNVAQLFPLRYILTVAMDHPDDYDYGFDFASETDLFPGHSEHYPPAMDPTSNMADMNHFPFSGFLRDVLYDQPFDPNRLAENQGLAVLDFCDNTNLDMTDMDFGLLDHWNGDGMMSHTIPTDQATPQTDGSVDISHMRQNLVKVWTDSPWRWDPKTNDSGYREQGNLPVSTGDTASAQFQERRKRLERLVKEKLEPSGRDRVLAIVLEICRQNSTSNRVAASFPSVDVIDTLVHIFLNSHACQVSAWIHFPTLKLSDQWPEWVAVAAAGGAVLTPFQTLRKFGFALQEAVRLTIPSRFEDNNTSIQNLGLVQSLILGQDIGLWSGNRRKMEIAECHLVIPVTMMRYRGKFQHAAYPVVAVDASDEGPALEEKWRTWIEMEQWKRLVFHCYLRDAQTSMTTLTNPAMSYSELTLPLPESRQFWFAKTAKEWKALYLERNSGQVKKAPSVGDLFHDISPLTTNRHRLDVQLSTSVLFHAYWALILEYRQLSTVHRTRTYTANAGGTTGMLLMSRHQELVKDLQNFQAATAEWSDISAQEHMILNLLMMNLHVSLDDLQLFAGKEGEDEARRIYPVLQQWAESTDARSAIWCAGQVLRYAKLFPQGHLKDFYAVAVHHAALALWAYGVVTRANRRQPVPPSHYESVYLDGPDSMSLQRFISLGQGQPVIRGPVIREGASEASVEDPRACMEVAQEVLKANFMNGQEGVSPIVENLCVLIRQLGNAAWAVGLG